LQELNAVRSYARWQVWSDNS